MSSPPLASPASAQQPSKPDKSRFVYLIAAVAAIGGMLFGYDTGVISGAILFIQNQFALTDAQVELVVSGALIGATISSVFGGMASDKFGRRHLLLVAAGLFGWGSITSALAHGIVMLVVGRIIVGIGIGLASFAVPLYIAELAPEEARGWMVSLNQLALTIGILLAYVVDFAFSFSGDWRWMLGLAVLPALLLAGGMAFLPDSPRWLTSKGREQEARDALIKIRSTPAVDAEYQEIQANLAEERGGRWLDMFRAPILYALLVGLLLAIFQQVTGINTVIYYAPTILGFAGYSSATASILATAGIGVVNTLVTVVAMFLVDRLGRRPLLLGGMAAMAVALMLLGLGFAAPALESELGGFTVVTLMLYIGGFAIGLGPIFWLIISEIYPQKIRGQATGLVTTVNWGANLLVSLTFLTLVNLLGQSTVFWLYGAMTVAAIVYTYFRVPETKGRTLEQIQQTWRDRRPLRRDADSGRAPGHPKRAHDESELESAVGGS